MTTFTLFVLCLVSLVSTASIGQNIDSVTGGTELVYAFLTHRHGDRTPVEQTMVFLGLQDYNEVQALIDPYGYGELTNAGKRTGYKTGQFIKRRFKDIISENYNKSEIFIRSTDSTRTKMTLLTALSAVYPAMNDSWSKDINWEPIPYTTIPVKYDFNQAVVNCPTLTKFTYSIMMSPNSRMDPYSGVIEKVSNFIGYDITRMPLLVSAVYDVYVSVISLGFDIKDEIKELMPALSDAAGTSWDITYGNDDYLPLEAGVTLKEFFKYADETIAGRDTQKLRIYSAHDANVYALEAISRATPRQGAPKYGSLFSLELRRVVETGQYVVLLVYLPDPHVGEELYLQVDGCGDLLCDFETFKSLTASFLRDEDTWRSECGFREDMVFDSSGVD